MVAGGPALPAAARPDGRRLPLDEALALTTPARWATCVVVSPRLTVDSAPARSRADTLHADAEAMLYGTRATIAEIADERDAADRRDRRHESSCERSRRRVSRGASRSPAFERPCVDGERYTLDPDPNNWLRLLVREGRRRTDRGGANTLYDRLDRPRAGACRLASTRPRPARRASSPGSGRAPRARRAPRLRAGQARLHRRARRRLRSCSSRGRPARARATRPPSPSSRACRARWPRAGLPRLPLLQDARGHRCAARRTSLQVQEKLRRLSHRPSRPLRALLRPAAARHPALPRRARARRRAGRRHRRCATRTTPETRPSRVPPTRSWRSAGASSRRRRAGSTA